MTHTVYLVAAYGLSTAILGGYAAWVIGRRRSLARTLGLDGAPRPGSPE